MSDKSRWRDLVRTPLRAATAYHVPSYPNAIKLDANESPYALSRAAQEAVVEVVRKAELNRYPDPTARALKELMAVRLGVEPAQLLLGNGSDELIGLLCAAFGEPRKKNRPGAVLYAAPGFVVFRTEAIAHGLTPVEVALGPNFEADEVALLAAVEAEQPNLVFLATPNNPTGTEWPRSTIAQMLVKFPHVMTVVDEAYLAYSDARSCIDLALAHPNCVVLQTVSKIGLAGLRVGMLVGRAEVVAEVEKVRPPYNLNVLSQRAAHVVLSRFSDELAAHYANVKAERERLRAELTTLGLEVFPSGANFLLARVTGAADLYHALAERGVVVRLFDKDALARCMRITVGTPEENQWFLDALRAALKKPDATSAST